MSQIPVTIIGGFLGAGKTTLVNHLVASSRKKFGIVVNEFGEASVDGSLIENIDTDGIAELSNGCLCCIGKEDLSGALFKLYARKDKPEHILVELSGVADPVPVAQTILDPFLKGRFYLDGILGVADARNLEATLAGGPEGAVQLAYASAIVLNKTDLATPMQLEAAKISLERLNPLAVVLSTSNSKVDTKLVLDLKDFENRELPDNHETQHAKGLKTFTLESTKILSKNRVNEFIDTYLISRPNAVLRAKGFLSVEGYNKQVLFQSVREIFSLELTQLESTEPSKLVVIGRGIDKAEYLEAFAELS